MAQTEYTKVSQTYRAPFLVLDGRTPETGLSGWTIELTRNGVGNQSITGITITEIDAVNNAGEYNMEVNASTGFVTSTGSYGWVLKNTAASGNAINIEGGVIVTSDGTGEGTQGQASFTATTGDGRVTDGSSPLEDATVTVYDSSNNIVTQLTTDVDGLWGPVFLDNGSYTVYSQKVGYNQASGTITVSAGVATGPGTDLVSSVSSSATTITAGELWSYAKRQAHNHTGVLTDQLVQDLVNDAIDMVSKAHGWSFLQRSGIINLRENYNTGTIAITSGAKTVTLTGGVFPSWAADGEIRINNLIYDVASRDSDTQLTLTDTYGGGDQTGAGYLLYQDAYDLPTDSIGVRQFYYGEGWMYGQTPIAYDSLVLAKTGYPTNNSRSYYHAYASGKVYLYPSPSTERDVVVSYQKRIGKLTSASDIVDFDIIHLDLLHTAIDHQITRYYGQTSGFQDVEATFRNYHRHLTLAMSNDREVARRPSPTGTRSSGRLNDPNFTLSSGS